MRLDMHLLGPLYGWQQESCAPSPTFELSRAARLPDEGAAAWGSTAAR
jgi:hypothetical protein